jgi:phosphatidate cytidylyltransferase
MPWKRIFSAIVAIILALGLITLGGWYFTLGFMVIVFLGQLEYFELVKAKGIVPAVKTTLVLSQILLLAATIIPEFSDALFPLGGIGICLYLLLQPKMATIADISTSLLGLFYGGYLPTYWIKLREHMPESAMFTADWPWEKYLSIIGLPHLSAGLIVTLLTFGCIWAADIGGYVFGGFFGKTRLSEISPKKTVEGAIFGYLGSVAIAGWGAWYLGWSPWWPLGITLGILVASTSLLGDLTESMMKRDAGVKDSGQLIPGHGGILDRTDSYVFTAPVAYYFFTLVLPWLMKINTVVS